MRPLMLAILLSLSATAAHTEETRDSDRISVYVYAGDKKYGFADQDTLDSVKDLKRVLKPKTKILKLVETRADAEVFIHVLDRGSVGTGDYSVQPRPFGGASARQRRVREVTVELVVGDYSTPMLGSDRHSWSSAAHHLGEKIVKWLKANRERVMAMRAERE